MEKRSLRKGLSVAQLHEKASKISYLLLDVDGVMTNGLIYIDEDGRETKMFSVYDGFGISMMKKAGFGVGIITGRNSKVVAIRAKELGIEDLYQGRMDKTAAFADILKKHHLEHEKVAFIGDDLIDMPILEKVGLAVAVPNAVSAVKEIVDWITEKKGGEGAVRELVDLILASRLDTASK